MVKGKYKKIFLPLVFFSVSLVLVIVLTNVFHAFAAEFKTRKFLSKIENKSPISDTGNSLKDDLEIGIDPSEGSIEVSDLQMGEGVSSRVSLLEFADEQQKRSVSFETLNSVNTSKNNNNPKSRPYILDNLGENANFGGERSWIINNKSKQAKILYIGLENLVNLENGCNDQEKYVQPNCDQLGKEGDFGRIIHLKIALDGLDRVESTLETSQEGKIAKDWAALPKVVLQPKEKKIITAHWTVDENQYGNEIQSDSVRFDISFQLAKDVVVTEKSETVESNKKFLDTDQDGLNDYEEKAIYNTDPLNADTDGDGYLDGVEVMSGYSPLKAAKKKE